uniref:BTB domain-containing protein n=1 Tax=Psilocybe cubensis TaxID=181762 RepID=A0A8H7Y638_PSICU
MHEDNVLEVQTQMLASEPVVMNCASEKQEAEPPHIRHHPIYYIEMMTIQIGGDLFRLPSYDFSFLKERYPGSTNVDDSAVNLTGVITSLSFCRFLMVLYPIVEVRANYDEWVDTIKLSTLWGFNKIRAQGVKALNPLVKERSITETILTAKALRVRPWLIDAYETLAIKDTLTEEELRTPFELDWETIARICLVRLQKPGTTTSSNSQSMFTVARPRTHCQWCGIQSKAHGSLLRRLQCPYTCRNLGLNGNVDINSRQISEAGDSNTSLSVSWVKRAVEEVFKSELNSMVFE